MYVPSVQPAVPPATRVWLKRPDVAPTSASQTASTVPLGLISFRVTAVEGPGAGDRLPVMRIVWLAEYDAESVETVSVRVVWAVATPVPRTNSART